MTIREAGSGLILVVGACLSVAVFLAIVCAAWFLFGSVAAMLCLAGLVAGAWFALSAIFLADRPDDAEFCAPEGAIPQRERA